MRSDRPYPPLDRRYPRGDRGDIILGWLTRVIVLLTAVGLMAFDAVSVGAGHFRAEDHAQQAVREASTTFRDSKDVQAAYVSALNAVAETGDTIDPASFTVGSDGAVTLTLVHETPTLMMVKIPPLVEYTTMSKTVTGRAAS